MDELIPELKDACGQSLNRDPQIAMHLAEAMIFAADLTERADYRALGVMTRGGVFGVLGRHEDVIAAMDEANASGEARSGVMSRKRMPGFGKSGTSRTNRRSSFTS